MNDELRGTGRTSELLEKAPREACFIVRGKHTEYTKQLAKKIGRDDLQIKPLSWLTGEYFCGLRLYGLILDHDVEMTDKVQRAYNHALPLVRGLI